jgi:hypothetical protein
MSVLSVNLLYTGRSATETLMRRRTYTESWEVICDSVLDNEQTVSNALGIPRLGSRFVRDAFAYCTDIEPSQNEDNPFIWYVTVKYDSKPDMPNATGPDGATDPAQLPDNPLARPATWKITFAKSNEVEREWFPVDDAGNVAKKLVAIRNSAKLLFDPPVMVDVARPVLRVTKNVPEVTLQYLLTLQDAVNKTAWRGLAPRQARIDGVDAGNKLENGIAFVELTVDIMLKRETWDIRVLDAGYGELTERTVQGSPPTTARTWTKIRDQFSNYITEPVPLNGMGKKLNPDADPVFLRGVASHHQLQDFTALLNF